MATWKVYKQTSIIIYINIHLWFTTLKNKIPRWQVMHEERTGKRLRQVKHIRGHLWHRCSVMVNLHRFSSSQQDHTLYGAPEFTPDFSGVRITRSLVLCLMFCRSLFVLLSLFLVVIVLFVLLFCTLSILYHDFWLPLWYLQTSSKVCLRHMC
jgi:hypothetical protein